MEVRMFVMAFKTKTRSSRIGNTIPPAIPRVKPFHPQNMHTGMAKIESQNSPWYGNKHMESSTKSITWLNICLTVLILASYALFLGHKIDLSISDLGRHLQNGHMTLAERAVLATNFYSYTEPDFPAPNHHWGSGALFFLVWQAGGFGALHFFFITLSLATLLIFFLIAARSVGFAPASALALAALPLLAERTEIRPEVFSYLLCGIFFWALLRWRETRDWRLLAILPVLEILWVNLHIYFFLGPALIATFLAENLLRALFKTEKPDGALARTPKILMGGLAAALGITAAASLLNPFGVHGALAPLTIFENYGYRIAENQSVWFVEKILRNPNYAIFKIVFTLLAAGFVWRLFAKRSELSPACALIAAAMSAMAWLAVRNFALFGFFFIPLAAHAIAHIKTRYVKYAKGYAAGTAVAIVFLMAPALFGQWQKYFPYWHERGVGLEADTNAAADFFREQKLTGPIFNNYDIGGYLIFHLFPDERVFVDNRPEAYSVSFFTDTYVPMQEDDTKWRKELARWNFNAIFFSWRDATPWAQQFLAARIKDPLWAPVFADRHALILLKRAKENKTVIERFELPPETFRITQTSKP